MAYIQTILAEWEAFGVFDFVLPFLLIFAVIFGVLTTTNVFGPNKAVHIIIAIVIAILSLRIFFVQEFFREIFPRLAVALSVILVTVILTAIFIPKEHMAGWAIAFYSIGGLAAIIVIFNSFSAVGFFGSNWWYEWGSSIIGALFVIGVIIAISVSGKPKSGGASKGVSYGKFHPDA